MIGKIEVVRSYVLKKLLFVPLLLVLLAGCQKSQEQIMEDARKARMERLAAINAKVESDREKLKWIPNGFTPWGDGSKVAYKQVGGNCTNLPCSSYEVVAKNGCPNSLYMESSVLDSAGRNRGTTNDRTSGVRPGQIALLTLEVYQNVRSPEGRIIEISCY
tara:strand:- start:73 stop:555 length:483 start_codon:yes stop_codon:yes gene_type:complete